MTDIGLPPARLVTEAEYDAVHQTTYVVTLPDDSQVLVIHQTGEAAGDTGYVHAAQRPDPYATWGPPLPVEIRP